jgi:ribonuclease T1
VGRGRPLKRTPSRLAAAVLALAGIVLAACGPAAPAWDASSPRSSVAPGASGTTSARAPGSVSARPAARGGGFDAVPAGERSAVGSTLRQIAAGGPFPHRRDGIVFANREGRLPPEPAGYYHEYTVETPGSADRGARRLVTGRGGEAYYSNDHYRSFLPLGPIRNGAPR